MDSDKTQIVTKWFTTLKNKHFKTYKQTVARAVHFPKFFRTPQLHDIYVYHGKWFSVKYLIRFSGSVIINQNRLRLKKRRDKFISIKNVF